MRTHATLVKRKKKDGDRKKQSDIVEKNSIREVPPRSSAD